MTPLDFQTRDPVAWCEKHIMLDYGKFDREKHPLLVEPLRSAASMRGGMVGLIGSVQHIKTLTAQLWQLYAAHVTPARAAHYDLTNDTLKEFSDDKFQPLIDSTTVINSLIPSKREARTKTYTSFPYGFIRLLSAGVLANRNSKTLERISLDESWAYEGGWIEQIHDRQSSFTWSWQMFLPTSGQTADSELDKLWRRSSQKVWHVQCDCCGEWIPYIWMPEASKGEIGRGGMRFISGDEAIGEDGEVDFKRLRESVYYECQLCGGRMDYSPGDVARRNAGGKYISQNPSADPAIDFFHYNAIAHYPWPDLAELWRNASDAKARGDLDGLENFVRKRLAQPWDEGKYVATDDAPENCGDYMLGEHWNDAQFHFATVDVQQDHYYLIIRAWAMVNNRIETRLIEREKCYSTTQIRDLCNKWNIPQGGLNNEIGCRVFLDGNYNTAEVRRICAENGWMMLRGQDIKMTLHADGLYRIYAPVKITDAFEGTAQSAAYVGEFFFSNHEARSRLAMLRAVRDPLAWSHSIDCGEQYLKQLNAWVRIAKTKPKDGSTYYAWIQRGKHDHFHDCEKMQIVCAAMAGLVGSTRQESTT